MMKLTQCGSCHGFLPRGATKCPHCSRRALTKKLCAVGATLGAGSLAFTLMACYGAAPCPDGTRDCYKNPPAPNTETEAGAPTSDPTNASPDGGN